MNDKELLELAAKAAGYTLEDHYDHDQYYPWCTETDAFWNPLLDDGDALRLMVNFGMDILFYGYKQIIAVVTYRATTAEPYSFDMKASTRRAIVKASAEIGKEMK